MVRLEIHQKLTSRSHVLSLVLSKTEDILYHGVLFWSYPTHSQNGPYGMYISDFSRRFEADFTTSSLSLQYGIRLLLCKVLVGNKPVARLIKCIRWSLAEEKSWLSAYSSHEFCHFDRQSILGGHVGTAEAASSSGVHTELSHQWTSFHQWHNFITSLYYLYSG